MWPFGNVVGISDTNNVICALNPYRNAIGWRVASLHMCSTRTAFAETLSLGRVQPGALQDQEECRLLERNLLTWWETLSL